jgi:hypothetical protein
MQVKATITHTIIFEAQAGSSIEAIRAQATSQIDDFYSADEGEGSIEDRVTNVIERALPGLQPRHESVGIQITEVK